MTAQDAKTVGLVNSRLWKELRMLWLPAAVAAVFACLIPVFRLLDLSWPGDIFSLLRGFAWLGFLGCVLFLAAAPVGWEFQHRTMSMLLAQPSTRSRLWRDKLLAASLWAVVLCVAAWLTNILVIKTYFPHSLITRDLFGGERAIPAGDLIQTDFAFLLLLVPAVLCAAPVFTLITRSTIGGVTFTIASQFIAALLVDWLSQKIHFHQGVSLVLGAIAYSLLFLWLGWRMFSRLQVTDTLALASSDSDGVPVSDDTWRDKLRRNWAGRVAQAAWLDRALRCGPLGATTNLFRKELRLQKPVFQVGLFFALCWAVVFALTLIQPEKGYHHLYDVIIAFHVPLVFLLAGSVSISDENMLGVAGWHLTLPVPAAKQWSVKLAASAGAGMAVGWVLPLILLCVTSFITQTGHTGRGTIGVWAFSEPGLFLLCASVVLFVMSFWAVSLLGNTVRAVMTALLGLVVLFFAFMLAHWWARNHGGFSAIIALNLESFLDAPAGSGGNYLGRSEPYVMAACLLALGALALAQALQLFSRPDAVRKRLFLYSALLVLGVLLMGAVVGDLEAGKVNIARQNGFMFQPRQPRQP